MRRTRRALNRRTSLTCHSFLTTPSYDPASQLTSLAHTRTSDGTRLQHFTLTYDPAGNRTSQTTLAGTDTYAYDALNRLTSATHPTQPPESYTYDPVGNRTTSHLSTTHRYDAANRLLEDDTFTYGYDPNGNLTTKSDKTTGEVTIFTYDAQDQLIGVTRAIPPFVPTLVVDYRYDALGRRVLKRVNGLMLVFLYDQEDLVAILAPDGTPSQVVHHGPGIDEPLFLHEPQSGETLTYLADPLGSIILLVRPDGSVAGTQLFDAFGRRIAHAGIVSQPYGFTGREHDPETGLIYFRTRYYDPDLGRFIQEDPGELDSNWNPYHYAFNNPLLFVDPFGLSAGEVRRGWLIPLIQTFTGGRVQFGEAAQTFSRTFSEPALEQVGDVLTPVDLSDGTSIALSLAGGTTLKVLKKVRAVGGTLKTDNATLMQIFRAERPKLHKMEKITIDRATPGRSDGALSRTVKYVSNGQTNVVLHEVVDRSGRIIHRDIKSIRISSGQVVNSF